MARYFKTAVVALVLMVGAAAVTAEDAEARRWRVGLWTMQNVNANGRFEHCRMWAEYNSGITLYFAQMSDYRLWIGMSHPNWRLDPNANYTMTLYIDGRVIRRARGVVRSDSSNLLWLDLQHDRRTRHLLRRRFSLVLSDGNNDYSFRLRGTSAGLTALENCVSRYRGGRGK
jgi:hypothetical protein